MLARIIKNNHSPQHLPTSAPADSLRRLRSRYTFLARRSRRSSRNCKIPIAHKIKKTRASEWHKCHPCFFFLACLGWLARANTTITRVAFPDTLLVLALWWRGRFRSRAQLCRRPKGGTVAMQPHPRKLLPFSAFPFTRGRNPLSGLLIYHAINIF